MAKNQGVRFEFPSVEHPSLLEVLFDEAQIRGITVDRVSHGGGIRMLTNSERRDYIDLAHDNGAETYFFMSSRNSFEGLVDEHGGEQLRGELAFRDAVDELSRCESLGIDGVLIADVGLLSAANAARQSAILASLAFKTSIAIAPLNAATAVVYETLGATSINVSPSSSIEDLAAMRSSLLDSTSLDIYVESSPEYGGSLRYRDVRALAASAAPVYFKFALRNGSQLYPYGRHLEVEAEACTREKVRRASLVAEELERFQLEVSS